jgi:hypothetical protein
MRNTSKTKFFYYCGRVRFHGNLLTEPLLRNGLQNASFYCCVRVCCRRSVVMAAVCSHSLSTCVYVTTYIHIYIYLKGIDITHNPVIIVKFRRLKLTQSQIYWARSPYLYPPGNGWLNCTPRHWVPFPSPFTTRRATAEVFEPASTRDIKLV